MTQLEDCYFCGTVGESLESYPVIPAEAAPPEDAQRTVVVCPTCSAKLDRVIDPVVEHLGAADQAEDAAEATADTGDDGGEPPETSDDGGEPPESGTVRLGIGSDADDSEEHRDGNGEGAKPAEGDEGQSAGNGEDRRGTADPGDDGDGPATTADDGDGSATTVDDGTQVELPEETADMVRLLRNREFPVEREEIVVVAANAYEIGRRDSERAIDALIAAGHLTERDGELHPDR